MEIVQIGNFMKGISTWENPSVGRVYDQNFLAPTLNSGGGGGRQPYIIVEVQEVKKQEKDQNKEKIDIRCLNSRGGRNGIPNLQPSLCDRVYDSEGVAAAITTSPFFMPTYLVREEK